MNIQFKKGVLELCILKIISYENQSAYEVIELVSKDIDVTENTIYPILRRLTNEGYFVVYKKPTAIGAPRKYYQITQRGLKKLSSLEKDWERFLIGVSNIMSIHKDNKEDVVNER